MRINTRTGKIELLKTEQQQLVRTKIQARTLSKHADGEIARLAERISDDIGLLQTALAEQGQEAEVVNAPY